MAVNEKIQEYGKVTADTFLLTDIIVGHVILLFFQKTLIVFHNLNFFEIDILKEK